MTFLRYFQGSLKKAGVSKSYWYFKGVRKTPGNPSENAFSRAHVKQENICSEQYNMAEERSANLTGYPLLARK